VTRTKPEFGQPLTGLSSRIRRLELRVGALFPALAAETAGFALTLDRPVSNASSGRRDALDRGKAQPKPLIEPVDQLHTNPFYPTPASAHAGLCIDVVNPVSSARS
jgi:hypothetical protein